MIQLDSIAAISNTEFCDNRANGSGGVLIIILLTNVTIESSMFLRNSADRGGVIHIADASELFERECMYEKNMAVLGGVASIDQDSLFYDGQNLYYDNRAEAGGALYAIRSQLLFADIAFSYNQALKFGGAMYTLQCQEGVTFSGFSTLTHNYAGIGEAVYAVESSLHVYVGQLMTITFNIASHTGGGMFLYRSTLSTELHTITDISNNKAEDIGAVGEYMPSTQ